MWICERDRLTSWLIWERKKRKKNRILSSASRHVCHCCWTSVGELYEHDAWKRATIGRIKRVKVPYVKWKILNYMYVVFFLFMDFYCHLSALLIAHISEVIKRRIADDDWKTRSDSTLSRESLIMWTYENPCIKIIWLDFELNQKRNLFSEKRDFILGRRFEFKQSEFEYAEMRMMCELSSLIDSCQVLAFARDKKT